MTTPQQTSRNPQDARKIWRGVRKSVRGFARKRRDKKTRVSALIPDKIAKP
jgi:hypothetical protein